MVECGGLENRCTARYQGFESLTLRHRPLKGYFFDSDMVVPLDSFLQYGDPLSTSIFKEYDANAHLHIPMDSQG